MEITFIKVYFWIGLAGLFIKLEQIIVNEYPREVEVSIKEEFFLFLYLLGFVIWSASILWLK